MGYTHLPSVGRYQLFILEKAGHPLTFMPFNWDGSAAGHVQARAPGRRPFDAGGGGGAGRRLYFASPRFISAMPRNTSTPPAAW